MTAFEPDSLEIALSKRLCWKRQILDGDRLAFLSFNKSNDKCPCVFADNGCRSLSATGSLDRVQGD